MKRFIEFSFNLLRFSFVILVSIIFSNFLYSQELDFRNSFELSGSLSYNSSSYEGYVNGSSIKTIYRQKYLSIFPSVGYFFLDDFEILFEPRYTLTIERIEQLPTSLPFMINPTVTVYQPGVALGVYYQVSSLGRIIPFAGFRCGIGWFKTVEEYEGTIRLLTPKPKWSKPEIFFPDVAVGVKLFVTDNWAGMLQIKYAKVKAWNGMDGWKGSNFDIGLGFLVIL